MDNASRLSKLMELVAEVQENQYAKWYSPSEIEALSFLVIRFLDFDPDKAAEFNRLLFLEILQKRLDEVE